jgi:hypothetical protein
MLLSRIPVCVVASCPHEYNAIADVLAGGQVGALTLASDSDHPIVALVCPSGILDNARGVPAVVLNATQNYTHVDAVKVLNVPVPLADVLTALELAAQDSGDSKRVRVYGGWCLTPAMLMLKTPDGRDVILTDIETRLMALLFDSDGVGLDKETLLKKVWGYRVGLETHTLETHIYRLRQKIETNPTNPRFLMTTETGYVLI